MTKQTEIRKLIIEGKDYNLIFEKLEDRFKNNSKKLDIITLLQYRFYDLRDKGLAGTISDEKFTLERRKIFSSILELSREIDPISSNKHQSPAYLDYLSSKLLKFTIKSKVKNLLIYLPFLLITSLSIFTIYSYQLYFPKPIKWKLSTTWKNIPSSIPYQELQSFLDDVKTYTNGRLIIEDFSYRDSNGKIVNNPDSLFEEVNNGKIDALYSVAYNWINYAPDSIRRAGYLFASFPFGKKFEKYDDWLERGNGKKYWRDYYQKLNFKVIPFSLGHTGEQYGGWFKFEISKDNLSKLNMRIPEFQGEILESLGGPTTFFCHQRDIGEILKDDHNLTGLEWIGPHEDCLLDIHKHKFNHYYKEGWHEPDCVLELLINENSYNALPAELQRILELLTQKYNYRIYIKFQERNNEKWAELVENPTIITHDSLPDWFKIRLKSSVDSIIKSEINSNPVFEEYYNDYIYH